MATPDTYPAMVYVDAADRRKCVLCANGMTRHQQPDKRPMVQLKNSLLVVCNVCILEASVALERYKKLDPPA